MVRKGRLNESTAPIASEELLVSLKDVVIKYARLRARFAVEGGTLYPVVVSDLLLAVRRIQLYAHFEEDVIRRRRAAGQIAETWNGDRVSYSPTFAPQDLIDINRRVEQALTEKTPITFRVTLVDLEPIRKRLKCVADERGEALVIPEPSFPPVSQTDAHMSPTSEEQAGLRRRVRNIFVHALSEYRALVEMNFATLKQQFSMYSRMPVHLVVAIEWLGDLAESNVHVYSCPSDSDDNLVTAVEFARERWSLDRREWSVDTSGGSFRCFAHEVHSLYELVVRGRSHGLEFEHPSHILSPLVYGWIQREFDAAARHLVALYGLDPDDVKRT